MSIFVPEVLKKLGRMTFSFKCASNLFGLQGLYFLAFPKLIRFDLPFKNALSMSKKTTNLIITALILLIGGGYLCYIFLPAIVAFAYTPILAIVMLVGIPLVIYGIYRFVSFVNK